MFRNIQQLILRSIIRGRPGTQSALRLRLIMLRRASVGKIFNFLSIKIQKRLRHDVITAFPYRFKIDPTNVCQLHCPLCPTGLKQSFRAKGFLPLSEFQSIVDQISSRALILDLFGWGEPMLHPDISPMVRYATDRNVFTRMSSTLHQVQRCQLEELVDAGLGAIIVAIDGSTAETHQKFRAGSDFSQLTETIKDLVLIKKEKGTALPHITVRMLISRHNESQISEVKALAKELGVDAFTVGQIAINTDDAQQAALWLPRKSGISAYLKNLKNQGSCSDLWESLVINYDGGISPCCWQYQDKNDVGNCFKTPVAEIWNSPGMVAARRLVLGKDVPEEFKKSACHKCQGTPDYLS